MEKSAVLSELNASITQDPHELEAYILSFAFGSAVTTIRVAFNDYSGSDLVITNMTTLPNDAKNRGHGSDALQALVNWADKHNLKDIRAVQVQKPSESFWIKNNFARRIEPNPCNDYQLQNR